MWRDSPRALFTADAFNGEVPELELGGILIALRIKGEGEAEMKGFTKRRRRIRLSDSAGCQTSMPIGDPQLYRGA